MTAEYFRFKAALVGERHKPDSQFQRRDGRILPCGDSLSKLTVPALILKADASPETRKATEEWVSRENKDVKLVYIDDAGHNLYHDQLERTVKELREFLSLLRSPQQVLLI